jgi:hypothetical protein
MLALTPPEPTEAGEMLDTFRRPELPLTIPLSYDDMMD